MDLFYVLRNLHTIEMFIVNNQLALLGKGKSLRSYEKKIDKSNIKLEIKANL